MATIFQTIRTCDECTRIIGDDETYFSVERCSQQDTGRKHMRRVDLHHQCAPPRLTALFVGDMSVTDLIPVDLKTSSNEELT